MKFTKSFIAATVIALLALLAIPPDVKAQGYNASGPTYTYLINGTSNFVSVGSTVSVTLSAAPSIVLQKGKELMVTIPNVTASSAGATPKWEYNWSASIDGVNWVDGLINFTNVSAGSTAQQVLWKAAVTQPTNNNPTAYISMTNLYAIKLKTVTNRDQSRDGFASNLTYRFFP